MTAIVYYRLLWCIGWDLKQYVAKFSVGVSKFIIVNEIHEHGYEH